ncbi:MAG: NAD(P)/FAD-dependent oxidoreductase [Gammaproteobacteria bacterium]
MRGDDYVLVGDAFGFIDPIFSSGVFLAMHSASLAADAVDASLSGSPHAERQMRRFEAEVRRGLRMFSWFIYRFTTPALHNLFMAPRNVLGVRRAVTSVVAGDVFRAHKTDLPLALFKSIYYVTVAGGTLLDWLRSRNKRDQPRSATPAPDDDSTSSSPRATTS